MKKPILAIAVGAVFAGAAGLAAAEPETNVNISNVSQQQNTSNVFQLMDIGSVVGPTTSNAKTRVNSTSPFSVINQVQNGAANRQQMFVGTVFATAGSTAESNVRVNNINQTQAGIGNVQRMEVGTIGIAGAGLAGGHVPMSAGKTNVTITGTLAQAQAAVGNVQHVRVGTIRPF